MKDKKGNKMSKFNPINYGSITLLRAFIEEFPKAKTILLKPDAEWKKSVNELQSNLSKLENTASNSIDWDKEIKSYEDFKAKLKSDVYPEIKLWEKTWCGEWIDRMIEIFKYGKEIQPDIHSSLQFFSQLDEESETVHDSTTRKSYVETKVLEVFEQQKIIIGFMLLLGATQSLVNLFQFSTSGFFDQQKKDKDSKIVKKPLKVTDRTHTFEGWIYLALRINFNNNLTNYEFMKTSDFENWFGRLNTSLKEYLIVELPLNYEPFLKTFCEEMGRAAAICKENGDNFKETEEFKKAIENAKEALGYFLK